MEKRCVVWLIVLGLLTSVSARGEERVEETQSEAHLPASVTAFYAHEAPGLQVYEWLVEAQEGTTESEYRIAGLLNGQETEIEVELDTNSVPRELEIKYEVDRSLLSLREKERVSVTNLPAAVQAAAQQLVPGLVVTAVVRGAAGIVEAYDMAGQAAGFDVTLKMLADGAPLELEKERIE